MAAFYVNLSIATDRFGFNLVLNHPITIKLVENVLSRVANRISQQNSCCLRFVVLRGIESRRRTFFPELNEPARPMAAGPVSCRGGPGERGADRATRRSGGNPTGSAATRDLPGLDHGGPSLVGLAGNALRAESRIGGTEKGMHTRRHRTRKRAGQRCGGAASAEGAGRGAAMGGQ